MLLRRLSLPGAEALCWHEFTFFLRAIRVQATRACRAVFSRLAPLDRVPGSERRSDCHMRRRPCPLSGIVSRFARAVHTEPPIAGEHRVRAAEHCSCTSYHRPQELASERSTSSLTLTASGFYRELRHSESYYPIR